MSARREQAVTWWNPAAQMRPVLELSSFIPVLIVPRRTCLLSASSVLAVGIIAALSRCLCSEGPCFSIKLHRMYVCMLHEYHVIYSFRYYPRFHVTAVVLGKYYLADTGAVLYTELNYPEIKKIIYLTTQVITKNVILTTDCHQTWLCICSVSYNFQTHFQFTYCFVKWMKIKLSLSGGGELVRSLRTCDDIIKANLRGKESKINWIYLAEEGNVSKGGDSGFFRNVCNTAHNNTVNKAQSR
jgi:hypothetical protein